jgi:hypothetical protein
VAADATASDRRDTFRRRNTISDAAGDGCSVNADATAGNGRDQRLRCNAILDTAKTAAPSMPTRQRATEETNADAATPSHADGCGSVNADATAGNGRDRRRRSDAISDAADDGGSVAADATAGDRSDKL